MSKPPCPCAMDRTLWKDEPPQGGYIRTVCKRCGKWIGNRPSTSKTPKEPK